MRRRVKVSFLVGACLMAAGCGERNYDNPEVTAQDRAQGAELHPQILAEFGGAYDGPEAGYVARIGQGIAAAAGLADACTFTLVNTDVVNAFAVPGCYIYVTRGLFALVNSEAELASVLGHELGHIVAEHSERRERRALFSGIGAALVGMVTGSERLARIASSAAQLYTLRYSRGQEYESDDLGIRYLVEAGYDPYSAADMLGALSAHDQLPANAVRNEATSIPAWARTHPLTEDRIERAIAEAEETGQARGALPEGEEAYLGQVDGLLYGDDPEQGFVLGRIFAHPEMRISFEAPPGFTLTNTPRAVLLDGPNGARGEFGGGRLPANGLEGYVSEILAELLGDASVPVQAGEGIATRINGVPALIVPVIVPTPRGQAQVTIAAYAGGGGAAYHFILLGPPTGRVDQGLLDLFGSFRFLSSAEVRSLRPRRIEVVTAGPGDTAQSLAALMAYEDYRLERFMALNGLEPGQPVRPGDSVKLVLFDR